MLVDQRTYASGHLGVEHLPVRAVQVAHVDARTVALPPSDRAFPVGARRAEEQTATVIYGRAAGLTPYAIVFAKMLLDHARFAPSEPVQSGLFGLLALLWIAEKRRGRQVGSSVTKNER